MATRKFVYRSYLYCLVKVNQHVRHVCIEIEYPIFITLIFITLIVNIQHSIFATHPFLLKYHMLWISKQFATNPHSTYTNIKKNEQSGGRLPI